VNGSDISLTFNWAVTRRWVGLCTAWAGRHYLLGQHFKFYTNSHSALHQWLSGRPTWKRHRWLGGAKPEH
jgi:hypothetical protein